MGRLRLFASIWESFCPDRWVVSVVTTGYQLEFTVPPPMRAVGEQLQPQPIRHYGSPGRGDAAPSLEGRCVQDHWREEGPLFRLSFFLALKKNGSWRPVLNLRPLNPTYIQPWRFAWKLSQSFYRPSRLVCGQQVWTSRMHTFTFPSPWPWPWPWPFRLFTSPQVFTWVARVVVADLRRRGILLFAYLDD